ncbi:MAG: NADH-quinone oxidoreductase subunit C [Mariprofundaceae bacterium]|nr:NADH-quinone oxidoreductase subunit C [Mariprofundaceae bacterium]
MRHLANTWLAERLADHGIHTRYLEDHHPAHMPCLEIRRLDWAQAAEEARRLEMRLVAVWAAEAGLHDVDVSGEHSLYAYMSFAHPEHRHALLRTAINADKPELQSIGRHFIAACRMERSIQDMFGIRVIDILDDRLWLKHEHWPEDAHPLRSDFTATSMPPDPARTGIDYDFVQSGSEGVYEIPVGPVHAGIIEPGHFRFLAVGEMILNMEERLGYVHKGIEKAMQGKSVEDGIRLAARVSGDTTVGHAWAFAHACEYAGNTEAPKRASYLRGVLCERERIVNHIGDIGAICNDAGFAFMNMQMLRLREDMARLHAEVFGHRLLMDTLVPGGVSRDVDAAACRALLDQTRAIAVEVEHLRTMYADHPSIQERVIGAGTVSIADARDIGLLGFAGRASGDYPDERIEEAYPPYDDLEVKVAEGKLGDVATRVWVRFEEIAHSARMIAQLIETLPEGDIRASWTPPEAGVSGFAAVEGWRGEIAAWVRFGEGGLIDRYFVRDPSAINWLGLELAVRTVPVPDFPLCNKSFNCSYSGNDL